MMLNGLVYDCCASVDMVGNIAKQRGFYEY